MFKKPLAQVTKADIERLITDQVAENRQVDYKSEAHDNRESSVKDFLADVSAFANTSGGYLIYGISEQRDSDGKATGLPASADGIRESNIDVLKQRWESQIQSGIEPRISGLEIQEVPGFPNGPVLVLHIPKSWAAPHMVSYSSWSRFYARNNSGKYLLDVGELRSAFVLTEQLPGKARSFRAQRIAVIESGQTPFVVNDAPKLIMHVVPFASLGSRPPSDVTRDAAAVIKNLKEKPQYWSARYNFDGCLGVLPRQDDAFCFCYTQVFRSGIIEQVDAYHLQSARGDKELNRAFELKLFSLLVESLNLLTHLNVPPPYAVFVSLLNADSLSITPSDYADRGNDIGRHVLLCQEIIVEDPAVQPPSQLLRPVVDSIWQACGFEGSKNYDNLGNYVKPRGI